MALLPQKSEIPVMRQFRIEWGSLCTFLATSVIACRITVFSHALEALWFLLCMYIVVRKTPFNKTKIPFLTCILAALLLLFALRLSYTGKLSLTVLVMSIPLALSIAASDERAYPVLWFAVAAIGSAMALSQDALSIRYAEILGLDGLVSKVVTVLSGRLVVYGPSYLGLDLILFYTLVCLMTFALSHQRNPGMLVTYFGMGTASYLSCLLIFTKTLGLGRLGCVPFILCLAVCFSVLVGFYASSNSYCLVWNRTFRVKGLAGYAEDGGRLVIATGWEESRGTRDLAERFGFRVEPVPLGGFHAETTCSYRSTAVCRRRTSHGTGCNYISHSMGKACRGLQASKAGQGHSGRRLYVSGKHES